MASEITTPKMNAAANKESPVEKKTSPKKRILIIEDEYAPASS